MLNVRKPERNELRLRTCLEVLCSVHTGSDARRRVSTPHRRQKQLRSTPWVSYDFSVHTAKIYFLIAREHTRHLMCTRGKLQQLGRYTSRRNSILARWLAEAFHVIPLGDLRFLRFLRFLRRSCPHYRLTISTIRQENFHNIASLWLMPCPHQTSPGRKSEEICSHWRIRYLRSVEDGCGRHRKSYKSKTCDILNILLSNRRNR